MLAFYTKFALVGMTLIGGGVVYQESQDVPQDKVGGFTLEAGDHSLESLVDRSAVFLQRNYLYSQEELAAHPSGSIHLQNKLELDRKGCEEVLSQFLYAKGFAIVPLDEKKGIYEVIHMQGPKRTEIAARATWMSPQQVLDKRDLKHVVLCSVRLHSINAQTATTALRPFFSQGGAGPGALMPGNVGTDHTILLQGFAGQVAAAIELLQRVDEPNEHALKDSKAFESRFSKLEKRVDALEKAR